MAADGGYARQLVLTGNVCLGDPTPELDTAASIRANPFLQLPLVLVAVELQRGLERKIYETLGGDALSTGAVIGLSI